MKRVSFITGAELLNDPAEFISMVFVPAWPGMETRNRNKMKEAEKGIFNFLNEVRFFGSIGYSDYSNAMKYVIIISTVYLQANKSSFLEKRNNYVVQSSNFSK